MKQIKPIIAVGITILLLTVILIVLSSAKTKSGEEITTITSPVSDRSQS